MLNRELSLESTAAKLDIEICKLSVYRWYLMPCDQLSPPSRENNQKVSLGSEPEDSPKLRGQGYKEESGRTH